MAAVVDQVRRTVAPAVSLYVNAWNHPARRAYAKVGFRQTDTFSTLMF
jgi:predicted GNAT family acetyltransferase